MKPATKKALLKSIEHWRKNENVKSLKRAKIGMDYCALCRRFQPDNLCLRITKNATEFCPVLLSTRRSFCRGTPYIQADEAHASGKLKAFKKAAKKEREFLERLLQVDN